MKKEAEELIEKIGVLCIKSGFQPAMGRIFGYLMLAEPPHKTFEDIQRDLALSKSAVSVALNMLMTMRLVDFITYAGNRKRHFRINADGWITSRKESVTTDHFANILRAVLTIRSPQYKEFNDKLTNILEFDVFLNREIAAAIEKWDRQHKK